MKKKLLIIITAIIILGGCSITYKYLTVHKKEGNVCVYKTNDVVIADSIFHANFGIHGFISEHLKKNDFVEIRSDNIYLYIEKKEEICHHQLN